MLRAAWRAVRKPVLATAVAAQSYGAYTVYAWLDPRDDTEARARAKRELAVGDVYPYINR